MSGLVMQLLLEVVALGFALGSVGGFAYLLAKPVLARRAREREAARMRAMQQAAIEKKRARLAAAHYDLEWYDEEEVP